MSAALPISLPGRARPSRRAQRSNLSAHAVLFPPEPPCPHPPQRWVREMVAFMTAFSAVVMVALVFIWLLVIGLLAIGLPHPPLVGLYGPTS